MPASSRMDQVAAVCLNEVFMINRKNNENRTKEPVVSTVTLNPSFSRNKFSSSDARVKQLTRRSVIHDAAQRCTKVIYSTPYDTN